LRTVNHQLYVVIDFADPGDAAVRIVVTATASITATSATTPLDDFEVRSAAAVDPDVIAFVTPGAPLDASSTTLLFKQTNAISSVNRTAVASPILGWAEAATAQTISVVSTNRIVSGSERPFFSRDKSPTWIDFISGLLYEISLSDFIRIWQYDTSLSGF
jgi:hypothetical protein